MQLVGKFLSEIAGTFLFLSVIITSIHSKSPSSLSLAWLKIGLALSLAILVFGVVSGGNFNPAVSFMLLLNKQLNVEEFTTYVIAQLIGAFLAFLYFKYLNNNFANSL